MRWLVALLFVLFGASAASAQTTYKAASCNNTPGAMHVQAAIDQATHGDTVIVPVGACTWTVTVVVNTAIIFQGSGASAAGTYITQGCATTHTFQWNLPNTGSPRLTGFLFYTPDACGAPSQSDGNIRITGFNSSFRMDHNWFYQASFNPPMQSAIRILAEQVFGVADHNTFTYVGQHALYYRGLNSYQNVANWGDNSWAQPRAPGAYFTFEDNTFTRHPQGNFPWAIDSDQGARLVYRNNRFENNAITAWHGTDHAGRTVRGGRIQDIYRNFWTALGNCLGCSPPFVPQANGMGPLVSLTSGTGYMFSNIGSGAAASFQPNIAFLSSTSERATDTLDPRNSPWGHAGNRTITSLTCSGGIALVTLNVQSYVCTQGTPIEIFGASPAGFNGKFYAYQDGQNGTTDQYCGSGPQHNHPANQGWFVIPGGCPAPSATGGTFRMPFDQNATSAGKRVLDGPGVGYGALLPPRGIASAPWLPADMVWPNQILEPVYQWRNVIDGSPRTTIMTATPAVVVDNETHYSEVTSCITAGCASLATGVGRGTFAQRPGTCTAGVGYWATDQGGNWNRESPADHNSHDPSSQTHALGEDGAFYVCNGSNTFVLTWTPDDYPHPLVVGGGPPPNTTPSVIISSPSAYFDTTGATTNFVGACSDDSGACSGGMTRSNSNGGATTPAPVLSGTNWTITAGELNADVNTYTVTGSDGTLTGNTTTSILRRAAVASLPYTETCATSIAWPSRGPLWTHYGSTPTTFGMASNACVANAFAFDISAFTGFALNADHYFKVRVASVAPGSRHVRLCVNVSGSTGTNQTINAYCAQWEGTGVQANNNITRYTAGALDHVYQSNIDVGTIANGITEVEVRKVGTVLYMYTEDVQVASIDVGAVDVTQGRTPYTGGTVGDGSIGIGTAWTNGEIGNASSPADTTPPSVAIDMPTALDAFETTLTTLPVEAAVSDNVGIAACTWEHDRAPGLHPVVPSAGRVAFTVDLVAAVSNMITVRCADAAGSSTADALIVNITTQPPTPVQRPVNLRGIFQ